MFSVNAVLIVAGVAAFALLLFGFSAIYDARASRIAGEDFGAAAGVDITPLRDSPLLANRLQPVRWGRATRVGINPGRFVLNDSGLHWTPSFLTGRMVPPFSVSWTEVRTYEVKSGPRMLGRRVAYLTLSITDGTPLRFATCDPDGLRDALGRLNAPQ
jgi:hypothetical protein